MSYDLVVVTPENIEVTYEPAGIGSRFVAAALDHLLQGVLMLLGLAVLGAAGGVLGSLGAGLSRSVPFWVLAGAIVWVFVVFWGYFILFEILWAGQTPGKRRVGLRVIRDGGFPVDPFSVIIRNIVRLADLLPPIYGAGVISLFLSERCKRLGDWAAGTVVVKERRRPLPSASLLGEPSATVAEFMRRVPPVPDLPPEVYAVLRRFVDRRRSLPIPVQAHIALRLAEIVLPRLNLQMPLPAQILYADLLEAIVRRYVEDRGKV